MLFGLQENLIVELPQECQHLILSVHTLLCTVKVLEMKNSNRTR